MTHKLYINVYFIIFFALLSNSAKLPVASASSDDFFRRPSRNSNLVPRLAVVGVALLAILTDRPQLKKYSDYDYARSRRWSRTVAKAVPDAG